MTDGGIRLSVEGGTFQGVVAQSVVIENLTLYGNVLQAQPPAEVDNDTTPPCPYSGLAYSGPQDSALFFGRENGQVVRRARWARPSPRRGRWLAFQPFSYRH